MAYAIYEKRLESRRLEPPNKITTTNRFALFNPGGPAAEVCRKNKQLQIRDADYKLFTPRYF